MTEKALVPIAQKQVIFYEDEITAVLVRRADEQIVYIPIRPICTFLGISFSGQRDRLNRDPVLADVVTSVRVTRPQDQAREVLAIPLDYLNGWLFGINASRVKSEVRDRLIRYQRECYKVLAEAFRDGRLTVTDDPSLDELLQKSESEAVEAYKMLQAMVRLARNQILIEARLDVQDSRLEDHALRLDTVEALLGDPGQHVTPDQAMQLSQAVKLVALELGKRSKKNEYGAVYGQFYREFGITSYKQLPAARFDQAMAWLTDWYQRVTGATAPGEAPW